MNVILFDSNRSNFYPLSYTRPISEFRIGILTIKQKWAHYYKNISTKTEDYLATKYPIRKQKENLWIEANFKETDLTNVAIGQPAAVIVDSYPGLTLTAQVIGISPATGSEFSLLPAQNATGNWVKVVQRLPVRLAIDVTQTPKQLRAGMTVSVKIDTGRTMSLPRFLSPLTLLLSKNP